MAGYLTTHVLDTSRGRPAEGIAIRLDRLGVDGERLTLAQAETNADGRTDAPILDEDSFELGDYELLFEVDTYLRQQGNLSWFYKTIPIRFAVQERAHFHVPLLLSPHGYSTYRGS